MFPKSLIQRFFGRKTRPAPPPAQTSCSAPDAGPWRVDEWLTSSQLVLQSDAGPHRVALVVMGNFDSDEQRQAYANNLAAWLNGQVKACTTIVEASPERREPHGRPNLVVATAPASPLPEERPYGAYGCHCELPPGQTPDACVIDLNQREQCSLAQDGRARNSCEHWQPIQLIRAA